MKQRRVILAVGISLTLCASVAAPAEARTLWFADILPGLAEPAADPWACRLHTWFLGAGGGDRLFRLGLGTDVGLAQDQERRWSVEGRAGVFSRFVFNSPSFDLQSADFLAGAAWRQALGAAELETYAFHYSAHRGDSTAFADAAPNVSREQVRILLKWPAAPCRFYFGPRWIVHSDPAWPAGRPGVQAGAEIAWGPWYAGLDLVSRGEFQWDTDLTWIGGFNLSPPAARFAQVVHLFARTGHALSGQGEQGYECLLGVGIMVLDQGPR